MAAVHPIKVLCILFNIFCTQMLSVVRWWFAFVLPFGQQLSSQLRASSVFVATTTTTTTTDYSNTRYLHRNQRYCQMITNKTQINWVGRRRAVMRSGCGNCVCIWTINGLRYLYRHLNRWKLKRRTETKWRGSDCTENKEGSAKYAIAFDSRDASANSSDCEELRWMLQRYVTSSSVFFICKHDDDESLQ